MTDNGEGTKPEDFVNSMAMEVLEAQAADLTQALFRDFQAMVDDPDYDFDVDLADQRVAVFGITMLLKGLDLGAHMSMHSQVQSLALATIIAYANTRGDDESHPTHEALYDTWKLAHAASHDAWNSIMGTESTREEDPTALANLMALVRLAGPTKERSDA
jgi:hypothetical protein